MTPKPTKLKLNLGCGQRKMDGYVNVDASPVCGPDQVVDLEKTPWPWPDDAADTVKLIHVLEHLGQQPATFLAILSELWRVCCDGALVHIEVPHPRSDEFLGDPTHVRPVTPDTLALFSHRNNAEYQRIGAANTPLGRYLGIDFEIVSSSLTPRQIWLDRLNRGEIDEAALREAGDSRWNVYSSIQMTLEVVKPAGRRVAAPEDDMTVTVLADAAQAALNEGRSAHAASLLERLCELRPDHLEARCLLASCLQSLGRLAEARTHYQTVVDRGGRAYEVFNNLGAVSLELGDATAACRHFRAALELAPGDRLVRTNLAEAQAAAGDVRDAVDLLATLVEEKPDDGAVYLTLIQVFLDQGWFADAANAVALARRFGIDSPDLANQEGICARERFDYAAAVAAFERGLAADPGNAALATHRANALAWLGRDGEADAAYRAVVSGAPDYAEGRFAYACFLLQRGCTDPGWALYESRWQRGGPQRLRPPPSRLPAWKGETPDPAADDLLVFCEQGYGDNLQFVRLLPLVRPRFRRVALVARPALAALLARNLAGVVDVLSAPPADAGFRWQLPLLSLAGILGLDLARWGHGPAPYLLADPTQSGRWRERLPNDGRRRIGLCWSGGKPPRTRHRFDLPLPLVESLLAASDIAWVGLQKEGAEAWRQDQVAAGRLTDPMAEVSDFDQAAALVAALDAVVTCDTAIAHLAGALGKPTLLLLSSEGEWRWLQNRADTPWYPSLRLLRQPRPGDWAGLAGPALEWVRGR